MDNIKYSSKSMVDEFGRVFFFQDKVYRAINPKNEQYCKELLNSELFRELMERGFIPETIISDFKLVNYNLVLEHEKLIEIQQHEWSFEIFKNVSLFVLNFNSICNKYGYELKDAHTFNVLFRGIEPVYVDIGSIALKRGKEWIAINEFIGVFYVPIQFYIQNENYIVRKLVESNFYQIQTGPFQSYQDSALFSLLKKQPYTFEYFFLQKKIFDSNHQNFTFSILVKVLNKIYYKLRKKQQYIFRYYKQLKSLELIQLIIEESVLIPSYSEWDGYHKNNYGRNEESEISERFEKILTLINNINKTEDIGSIIDLAGNEGQVSKYILQYTKIPRIILTDYDSNAIDTAYRTFKNKNTDGRISIALLNFIFTLNVEDTATRFKSDIVLALAVTHHLILTQNFSVETILERLKLFTSKYVFVEFMPLGLWSIHTKTGLNPPEWYTTEWFQCKFESYFKLIHVEKLEENRILFVGKNEL